MLIQLIIFITKSKLFASEINREGKVETISINGNPEIKYEDNESIDEAVSCIFDFYNIDSFADDNFDIVILEAGTSRKFVKYLEEKCADANRLNIYSMEKLLPIVINNKSLLKPGEEITVAFADLFYKVTCKDNNNITIDKTRKTRGAAQLNGDDFVWFYKPVLSVKGCDESKLKEAETKIGEYEVQLADYIFKEAFEYHKRENYQKALTLYKKAADLGSLAAVIGLGWMYDMGQGVEQNYEKAVALYRRAAAQGNDVAQNNLGAKYENGQGVAKNYEKAVEFYRKAADQGNELALNNLKRFTICPNCGKILISGSLYCEYCGKQLR